MDREADPLPCLYQPLAFADQLDEGPIIAQQIIPVNHSFTAAEMMKAGKEIETAVLAKALRLVFEDRVLVYGNKTVVFE